MEEKKNSGSSDKMVFRKQDIFTIPNILTYFRILLVPVFIIVYLNSHSLAGHIWSIVIIAVAALTDVVDGIIARKYNMISDIGKIADPIADKAMEFAMLFCVTFKYPLVWILFIIFAVKEIVSLIFSYYLFRKGKHISGANWAGKLCTVVLYGVMLALIVLPDVSDKAVKILVAVSAVFMFLAFVVYMSMYVKLFIELRREIKEEEQNRLNG